ncbi:MAG: patatin-like phospholipase family protein, partial [Bacteroidales bacterium]
MRKLFSLLFIFLALNLHAERKTVGLVLGGGGAKGAAHVGVLKVLEEAGIPIDYIAGTSIGAIVGAFYACGHDAHEIDSLMRQLNWKLLLSDQSPHNNLFYHTKEKEWKYVLNLPIKKQISLPAGIINGQNILNLFSDLTVGYHDLSSFNNLPIPFACVATDLTKGNSITLDSGSLPLAMRASMSIPGIFMPVTLDSMILVDGGVLNNLPTNVVKAMGADITIGVDLSTGKLTNEDLKTFNGVVEKIVDMMGNKEYLQNKKELDLCLNPDLKGFGTMSFSTGAMDSMYQSGIEVARKHLPEILALKDKIYNNDTTLVAPLKPMDNKGWNPNDTIQIANIYFDSIPPKEYKWFKKKANLVENSRVTIREINHAISVLDGLDLFSSVTYKLSDSTPADLTFILEKKALNQINIGFRFDTESMASILLNTTFSQKFFKGSELSVTAKLDKNPYLSLEY